MQAQAPFAPYYGLWSRLDGFTGDELSCLLTDRKAVRVVLMRGTIHLVTADDCHRLAAADPADAGSHADKRRPRQVAGRRRPGRRRRCRQTLLDAEALTPAEVGARLAEQWPDTPPAALTEAARSLLPLVQVPPRALWQRSGQVRLTTATAWLGRPRGKALTIDDVVLRYLAAFGPAVRRRCPDVERPDPARRGGRAAVTATGHPFKSERGQALYDLPDAPRPDPDTPAPVRLVAPFDNILLSHAERTRIISDEHRKRLFSGKQRRVPRHRAGRRFCGRHVGTRRKGRVDQHAGAAVRPAATVRLSTRSRRREIACWTAPSTSPTRSSTSLFSPALRCAEPIRDDERMSDQGNR